MREKYFSLVWYILITKYTHYNAKYQILWITGITSITCRLYSLNSFFVLSNSLFISASCLFISSFSSLHTILIHFGGLCCLGCFPPKCGCSTGTFGGTCSSSSAVSEACTCCGSSAGLLPKICVITSSSCWEEIFNSLSFSAEDFCFFPSFSSGLLDTFLHLAFFPVLR